MAMRRAGFQLRDMPSHHIKTHSIPAALPTLLDAEEIAASIGVTSRTILNWSQSKKIPTALRIGRTVRFNPDDVARALGLIQ